MADRLPPPQRNSRQNNGSEKIVKAKSKKGLTKDDLFITGSIDVPFFAVTMALLTIGLVMLFSASYPYALQNEGNSYYFFGRQFIFAVLGVVVMLIVSKINYRWFKVFVIPLLVATIGLLCLVLVWHTDVPGGFKRWIPLGPFTMQPSDIAKFTITVVMASYVSDYFGKMKKMKSF